MYPTLIALQKVISYVSNLSLIVLLFYMWWRLRTTGFLVVAVGGMLTLAARVIQAASPPIRMANLPFSRALTLDDKSRATEFLIIYSCHIAAGILIVLGTIMVLRTWSNLRG